MPTPTMREIGSAAVEHLTSVGLRELRDVIRQAREQRVQVDADLKEAEAVHRDEARELERREGSFFRIFYKKRITSLRESVSVARAEIDRLQRWRETTHVDIDFDIGAEATRLFGALVRAFEGLRNSQKIWDLTSDRDIDRFRERSAASRAVDRKPAVLDFSSSPIVRFDGRAMRFENVNGEDILLYPGMVLMPRPDGAFALVDLRELEIRFDARQFVEDDAVPSDAKVVGRVWAKTNKDGSPDRRFRDNRQIPLCLYGHLEFRSPGGIREEYQFSDAHAAAVFADAFTNFKASLPISTGRTGDLINL